jgi:hypothetical protein
MDQENRPDDVQIDVEQQPVREERPETQRDTQVPEQDPNNSPVLIKEATNVIYSDRYFSVKQQRYVKAFFFIIFVGVLMAGRATVPNNEIACVRDKAFELLEGITKFLIATQGNEKFRDALMIIGSGLIDIIFLATVGYWVFHGRSSRLVITFLIFYGTRAIVQHIFWSPFPEFFWWENPGIPSLVVPYGRGSDFFFSGHSGFLVICLREWGYLGYKKMRNFISVVLVYTVFILLVYRIHYTADIFTGVFFADWCYLTVKNNQEFFDKLLIGTAAKIRRCFSKKQKPISV